VAAPEAQCLFVQNHTKWREAATGCEAALKKSGCKKEIKDLGKSEYHTRLGAIIG
jgi:hypothetical protein